MNCVTRLMMTIKRKSFLVLLLGLSLLGLTACQKENHTSKPAKPAVHKVVKKKTVKKQKPLKLANTKSKTIKSSFYSEALHRKWHYAMYLPAGYNSKKPQNFPVLCLMHGVYGKYDNLLQYGHSKQTLDRLMSKTKKRMVVVYPDGFNSFYVNQVHGMKMETAIMQDLLPFIHKKYHTATAAEKNCIGGISMGGYGAARLALKYPQKFHYACLISPAVWQNLPATNPIRQNVTAFANQGQHWSDKRYREEFPTSYLTKKDQKVNFFVETTATDTTVPVKNVDIFVNKLKAKKLKVEYRRDNGDNHGWVYWNKALPNAYCWSLAELNK